MHFWPRAGESVLPNEVGVSLVAESCVSVISDVKIQPMLVTPIFDEFSDSWHPYTGVAMNHSVKIDILGVIREVSSRHGVVAARYGCV